MQLAADGADKLCQPPLVGGVDVLIARHDLEGACLPLPLHLSRAMEHCERMGKGMSPPVSRAFAPVRSSSGAGQQQEAGEDACRGAEGMADGTAALQQLTWLRPSTICSASSSVSTPAFASAFAYAWLP